MNEQLILIIFGIVIWMIFWYLLAKLYFWFNSKKIRKDAIWKSKSVILGHVNEKIAPLLPEFQYNYKDLVFLWKWIDYIVFDWLSSWSLKQIVFLEIKSWKSNLNNNEKQIKKIVEKKKIKHEIMKI